MKILSNYVVTLFSGSPFSGSFTPFSESESLVLSGIKRESRGQSPMAGIPGAPRVKKSLKDQKQKILKMGTIGQAALKGTNLRGQTEPKRRFSLILADSRLLPEKEALGSADFRRKPQIGVCSLRFVPLSAAQIGDKMITYLTFILQMNYFR